MSISTTLKLIPFIASIGLYFTQFIPEHIPSLWATIVKCLPILSLALFTVLHEGFTSKTKLNRKIFTALLFSCVGDACLLWPEYFLHGVVAFGVAQIIFIVAAGFESLNMKIGLVLFPYANTVLYLVGPGVMSEPPLLAASVFLYSPILFGRVWLTWSKLFRNSPNWTTIFGAIGSFAFLVSDSYLSLNRFYVPLPYHQEIVMLTYYLAQSAVALTVLYQPTDKIKKRK
ncbi:Lysoplasmalogenase-like protein TMEM86A [Pseudolycoriella hygida]|uniref:lysoplasmalogenase n=1 Tax=Pseudolycoriella hygida TaxID=35572 RepID=A0A9Q0N288_9DIPT|nr:Lysoplasmalogenase-like protein TMEM86A [Pseudolycoriella hygida]